jgi:cytochrome oxidase assembly protein ShyY1
VIASALAACAAGIALGQWQSGRADEKRAAALAAALVSVQGSFVPRHTILLDNKVRHRRPGYEVVTPLRLQGVDEYVLVNRGWVEAPAFRDQLPLVRTPEGPLRIEGVERERFPRLLVTGSQQGKVRQTLEIEDFSRETGLRLQPRLIEQRSEVADGLLREWPDSASGVEKHRSYALQWYSLAGLAIALGVIFSFRKA